MLSLLRRDPGIGGVGIRLLGIGGGIASDGIRIEIDTAVGVLCNRYPCKGLHPIDAPSDPVEVQGLSSNCLLMRRSVFEEVGGWDTSYLLDDPEIADMSLAIRRAGYALWLDRASSATLLDLRLHHTDFPDYFIRRLQLCNIVQRHARWERFVTESTAEAAQIGEVSDV